jgi:hypothetical protein
VSHWTLVSISVRLWPIAEQWKLNTDILVLYLSEFAFKITPSLRNMFIHRENIYKVNPKIPTTERQKKNLSTAPLLNYIPTLYLSYKNIPPFHFHLHWKQNLIRASDPITEDGFYENRKFFFANFGFFVLFLGRICFRRGNRWFATLPTQYYWFRASDIGSDFILGVHMFVALYGFFWEPLWFDFQFKSRFSCMRFTVVVLLNLLFCPQFL